MPGRRGAGSRGLSKRKTPANSQREKQGKPRGCKIEKKQELWAEAKESRCQGWAAGGCRQSRSGPVPFGEVISLCPERVAWDGLKGL